MAVAFDAATETTAFTTTPDPFLFNHTPVGTPAGVVVAIMTADSADQVTSVSYGGVAMTRVAIATDTVTETLSTYVYFLGAGIPTGVQEVSINHTASEAEKYAVAVTVTAAANTEVSAYDRVQENATNPSVSVDSGPVSAMRICAIASGLADASNLTVNASMTAVHNLAGLAVGRTARVDRETSPSSGSTAIGYTASVDDCAMIVAAIGEIGLNTNSTTRIGAFPFKRRT